MGVLEDLTIVSVDTNQLECNGRFFHQIRSHPHIQTDERLRRDDKLRQRESFVSV